MSNKDNQIVVQPHVGDDAPKPKYSPDTTATIKFTNNRKRLSAKSHEGKTIISVPVINSEQSRKIAVDQIREYLQRTKYTTVYIERLDVVAWAKDFNAI